MRRKDESMIEEPPSVDKNLAEDWLCIKLPQEVTLGVLSKIMTSFKQSRLRSRMILIKSSRQVMLRQMEVMMG